MRLPVPTDNEPTDLPDDSGATHEAEIKEASDRPADSGEDIGPSAQR
jgi:hypothetical protein